MTESAPHLVKDSRLAHEAALEELPYRELELTAKRIGHDLLATEMDQRANSASEQFLADREDGSAPSNAEEIPAESEEKTKNAEYTDEQILDLLKDKPIAGASWLVGEGMDRANIDDPGSGKFKGFYSGNIDHRITEQLFNTSESESRFCTSGDLLRAYAEAHIPELVTFRPLKDGRVVLLYETVTKAGGYTGMIAKYKEHYKDGFGRNGNFLNYIVILSENEANDLSNAIKADPALVHRLTDTMMTKHFGLSEEEWSRMGPGYDAWRDIDEGTSKIALRTSLTDTNPTVLSF